jgi:hypothetical protein
MEMVQPVQCRELAAFRRQLEDLTDHVDGDFVDFRRLIGDPRRGELRSSRVGTSSTGGCGRLKGCEVGREAAGRCGRDPG